MFSYKVKVHTDVSQLLTIPEQVETGSTSLWGGPGIPRENTPQSQPLILVVRVDDVGEELRLFKTLYQGSGNPIVIGKLGASSVFAISLTGVRHVYARCSDAKSDSHVFCTLMTLAQAPQS